MDMETVNLPRYVSLLKNLRAIAFLDPNVKAPIKEIKWLRRRYRYRNVGIAQSLPIALNAEIKEVFMKKPFEILKFPLPEIDQFVEVLLNVELKVPKYVIESLVLASCYVSALVVLGRESFSALKSFVAWKMRSTAELPETEVKRNLRIVGYAILDFHDRVIAEAYKTLKEVSEIIRKEEGIDKARKKLEKLIDKRRKIAEKDGEKRFWRLRQTGKGEERTVIAYLDIIPLISEILVQKRWKRLIDFIYASTPNLSMALSLTPAFILQPD